MLYKENYRLNGKIRLLSGLHIGGNKDKIEIGGIDSPVIKHPISGLPYIPGSSIKGKMRFLLEWSLGKVDFKKNGEPHSCGFAYCPICRIFGSTDKDRKYGPTRLKVHDCSLILSAEDKILFEKGEWSPFEEKVENSINRLSGTAIHPRHIERVIEGLSFNFGLMYKSFKIDNEEMKNNDKLKDDEYWQYVVNSLYLLQEDALGGSGSRGYGRIQFEELELYKGTVKQIGFKLNYQEIDIK